MSDEIDALFQAEPITDLIAEKERTARMGKSRAVMIKRKEDREIWLTGDESFKLQGDMLEVYTEDAVIHIPPYLIRRMFEFLEGLP